MLPKLIAAGLCSLAVLLEGLAVYGFFSCAGENPGLFFAALGHVLSCGFLVLAIRMGAKGKIQKSFLAFAFTFGLVFPVMGMMGLFLSILPAWNRLVPNQAQDFKVIPSDRNHALGSLGSARWSPGGFRARLLNASLPASRRLPLVMALHRQSNPTANRLLKELLRDPNDEVRLAAYAILEKRERQSQATIAAAEAICQKVKDRLHRVAALHPLAAQHWEAVYQSLTEGELAQRHLEQALKAAEAGLKDAPHHASLLHLKGRILAGLNQHTRAIEALSQAEQQGKPKLSVLPYQAESAFHLGDVAALRDHLDSLGQLDTSRPMEKVIRFWLGAVT